MPVPANIWTDGPTSDVVDGKTNRTITEEFFLRTWDTSIDHATLASLKYTEEKELGVGDQHRFQEDCYLSTISSDPHGNSSDSPRVWKVTVTYTNNWDSGGTGTSSSGGSAAGATAGQEQGVPPSQREQEPLLRAIDIKRTASLREVTRPVDATGQPYCNSIGDPFDPAPTVLVGTVRYTIQRNLAVSSAAPRKLGWCNISNVLIPIYNDVWLPHELKVMSADAEPVYEKGYAYIRETYVLESGPNYDHLGNYIGWLEEKVNIGFQKREYIDGSYVKSPIIDSAGMPVSTPKYLSSTGAVIDTEVGGWESSLHYITFQPHKLFNMNLFFV